MEVVVLLPAAYNDNIHIAKIIRQHFISKNVYLADFASTGLQCIAAYPTQKIKFQVRKTKNQTVAYTTSVNQPLESTQKT